MTNWNLNPNAAYLHYTENETVHGVQFAGAPCVSVPLVCDACSSLLSKPIDVAKHGLIYAAAQKNMGPAGLTIVIIDAALLDAALEVVAGVLSSVRACIYSAVTLPAVEALTDFIQDFARVHG